MTKAILFASAFLISGLAHATDGRIDGCYKMNVRISSELDGGAETLLPTGARVCTVTGNLKNSDPDGMVKTGDIEIKITDAKAKIIADYKLGALSDEGAAGTIYYRVAKTVDDVNADPDKDWRPVVTFSMRNDHLKKGDYAGGMALPNSTYVILTQD